MRPLPSSRNAVRRRGDRGDPQSKPDLVFLDVQMPECDGFDVLEMLGRDLPPAVSCDRLRSLRPPAFEAGALDYLLKPFDQRPIDRALRRAKEKITHGSANLIETVENKEPGSRRAERIRSRALASSCS